MSVNSDILWLCLKKHDNKFSLVVFNCSFAFGWDGGRTALGLVTSIDGAVTFRVGVFVIEEILVLRGGELERLPANSNNKMITLHHLIRIIMYA